MIEETPENRCEHCYFWAKLDDSSLLGLCGFRDNDYGMTDKYETCEDFEGKSE